MMKRGRPKVMSSRSEMGRYHHEPTDGGGRWFFDLDGRRRSLEYRRSGGQIEITKMNLGDDALDQAVWEMLIDCVVNQAREEGVKVTSTRRGLAKALRQSPHWGDVAADD